MRLKTLPLFIAVALMASSLFAQKTNKAIHDKYEGQIVFAEESIDFENIDDGLLKERFTLLNTIYGRIFLEKPLAAYYDDHNWNYDYSKEKFDYNFSINIYIDGQLAITWLYELSPEAFTKSRLWDIVVAPKEENRLQYSMESNDWVDQVSILEDGEHEVKMVMRAENAENPGLNIEPIASGMFTLHMEKAKMDEFTKKFTVGLPKATIDDDELEAEVIDATVRMYDGMTPVNAIIIEPTGKFQYTRDMNGGILSRNFIAAVVLVSYDDKCYVKTARYFQDHAGYFEFHDVRMSKKLEDFLNYEIPCDMVKTEFE
jgi:hypothetical protein